MINLDYICIKTGQEIGKETDKNILQKSLGILQEDGVYAMFLWLENKAKIDNVRNKFVELFKNKLLKQYFGQFSNSTEKDFESFCKILAEIAKDIDKLLFMKKIIERTLTYAYYHARGKEESGDE